MKKHLFTLLSVLLIHSMTFAQLWTKQFNGTGNGADEIKAMAIDNAGNVYVTGYSYSGANGNDYVTIKYNASGVQQWLARYNGPGSGDDVANSIAVDNAGNVYVTGSSDQLTGTYINDDAATVKYNASGVQQWVARFDGVRQRADAGNAIKRDESGNIYISGFTTVRNGAYTKKDYLTVKYNASGAQQWFATYNGPGNQDDEAVALGLDASGNAYVTGFSFAGKDPVGENDYLTIKYSPAGAVLWTDRYNGPASEPDKATALVVDGSGNVYVTGYSQGVGLDYATIKYNASGGRQWVSRYDGPAHGSDLAFAVAVDGSGNVYVTGGAQTDNGANLADYLTLKYNSAGALQWTARYAGAPYDNDEAHAIAVDGSGNVYVTGYINLASPAPDIATIKYSASGVQQWIKRVDGTKHGADSGNAIKVDGNGNVYVGGGITGTNSGLDYITIKYSPSTTGSKASSEEIAQQETQPFTLLQNAPNPFNTSTKINFSIPADESVKLTIYDMRGSEVATLVNGDLKAGSYEVQWNAENAQPGMYLYRLTSGGVDEVKRMLRVE